MCIMYTKLRAVVNKTRKPRLYVSAHIYHSWELWPYQNNSLHTDTALYHKQKQQNSNHLGSSIHQVKNIFKSVFFCLSSQKGSALIGKIPKEFIPLGENSFLKEFSSSVNLKVAPIWKKYFPQ